VTRTLDDYDYYALLGVRPDASADAIRAAFHRFAAKYHPDHHVGAPERAVQKAARVYRRGAEAYRVLMNPRKRSEYDAQRELGGLRYAPAPRSAVGARAQGASSGGDDASSLTPESLRYLKEAEKAAAEGNLAMARFHLSLAERKGAKHPRVDALRAEISRSEG
jgi:curved DNA-binding protein CbpA